MDKTKRQRSEPATQCQYGKKCYRKNPTHFAEYAHKHLSNILDKGVDSTTKEYNIPDEFFLSRDVIQEQLKILEDLFITSEAPTPKEIKIEKNSTNNNDGTFSSTKYNKHIDENSTIAKSKQLVTISATQLKESIQKTMDNLPNNTKPLNNLQPSTSATSLKSTTESHANIDEKPLSNQLNKQKMEVKRNIHDYISVVLPKGQMINKLAEAAPYNFFLTAITDSKPTHNEPLSITLQEILDPSLGDIECSVQINFMIDIGWLLGHYYFAECLDAPLLVLYGEETPDLKMISNKKPQVTAIKVEMSSPFATHHTKMMLFGYKDGSMRVVVSTANLVEDDWHNRTQGLWISPKCLPLPPDADTIAGESPTGFKESLTRYLVSYNIPKLQTWITRIRKSSFTDINVFFVASTPGGHRETQKGHLWGHARVGYLLEKHSAPIDDSYPIVAQSSSIGSLGQSIQSWLTTNVLNSFRKDSAAIGLRRIPAFKMIYPSFNNVKNSHDDLLGGGCLPYRKAIDDKQQWLKSHLYQWKSKIRHRNQAMPHIKTYCRWSDRGLYWFLLTSANLSKAAWGAFNKGAKIDVPLRIMNYEAGVLFFPKYVLNKNERFFPMNDSQNEFPVFPMPYDLPLIPYSTTDTPFFMDYLL